MGNSHSNRVDDNRRRSAQGQSSPNSQHPVPQQDSRSQSIHIRSHSNSLRSSDIEIKTQSIAKSKFMNRKNQAPNEQNSNQLEVIELSGAQNEYGSQVTKQLKDSHGLFDYEEDKKMTIDHIDIQNENFLLRRENDNVISEKFDNFEEMRLNQQCLQDLHAENFKKSTATCLLKENNFWIFHKYIIEDSEEEKANPGEKLWLIMRHMANDEAHNFEPNKGYALDLGDTIKFGRVRYKVIMMHNQIEGQQDYMLTDRFQKKKHDQTLRDHGFDPAVSVRVKRRRSSSRRGSERSPSRSPSPPQANMVSPERATSVANIPRFQSQVTQFDAGLDNREGSYSQGDESMSQDMGDSQSSSDYTGSGDYQDDVSDNLSVRDDEADGLEDLQTVQQNDDATAYNYNTQQTGLTGVTGVTGITQDTLHLPQRARNDSLTQPISRFNSVAPAQDVNQSDLNGDYRPSYMNMVDDGQTSVDATLRNHSVAIRDTTGLGQTGVFFSQGRRSDATLLGGRQNTMAERPSENTGPVNTLTLKLANQEKQRENRRRKKYKKNQKQKLKLQLQIEAKAKEAIEGKVCRICLGEDSDDKDPLISPCKCAGTMSHIHLECLREWLNSKRSMKEGECVKTYCWKALECELCKCRFPGQVFCDGTSVSDKCKLSSKQIKKLGSPIEILEYERPDTNFIVIESVTLQNIRIVHVINMQDRQFIRVGRGHDADIRVTDISVSRFHAKINMTEDGKFFVQDNRSKFGTLVQIRKPFMLEKNKNNYLQMGRTSLSILIEDKNEIAKQKEGASERIQQLLCCKKAKKQPKSQKEISVELYPSEWNLQKEYSPADYNNTVIEQTRDDDQIAAQQSPSANHGSELVQVLANFNANNEEQKQVLSEEEEKESGMMSGENSRGLNVDNAFSVLEDQTIRAIIEEHGMSNENIGGNGRQTLEQAMMQEGQDDNLSPNSISRSRTEFQQPAPDLIHGSQIQQTVVDNDTQQQQLSRAIADMNTGCDKNSMKIANLGNDQDDRDQSALMDPTESRGMNNSQNELSIADQSIQDQTQLMGGGHNASHLMEESKLDSTGKKNLNSSLIDAYGNISPIQEEDDNKLENESAKDGKSSMLQQVMDGSDNQIEDLENESQN